MGLCARMCSHGRPQGPQPARMLPVGSQWQWHWQVPRALKLPPTWPGAGLAFDRRSVAPWDQKRKAPESQQTDRRRLGLGTKLRLVRDKVGRAMPLSVALDWAYLRFEQVVCRIAHVV
jgi:hypothetical protein